MKLRSLARVPDGERADLEFVTWVAGGLPPRLYAAVQAEGEQRQRMACFRCVPVRERVALAALQAEVMAASAACGRPVVPRVR